MSTLADHDKLLPAVALEKRPERKARQDRERCTEQSLDAMLACLDPNMKRLGGGKDRWLGVVGAFLDADVERPDGSLVPVDEVREKLRDWSEGGATYDAEKFDADCDDLIHRADDPSLKRIGLGTVYQLAKACGYKGAPPTVAANLAKVQEAFKTGETMDYGTLVVFFEAVLRAAGKRTRRAVRFGDIKTRTGAKWIVDRWLAENATCLFFGESESFKTYLVILLLLCKATGTPFAAHGDFPGYDVGPAAPVIIFAGEGYDDVVQRIDAAIRVHDFDRKLVNHNLLLVPDVYAVNRADGLAGMADEINGLGGKAAIIAVDTLNLALDGNEDASDEIKAALRGGRALAEMFGAAFVAVDHVGLSEKSRPRGSSAKKANSDTMILCEREIDSLRVTISQAKNRSADKSKYRATFAGQTVALDDGAENIAFVAAATSHPRPTKKTQENAASLHYEAQFLLALKNQCDRRGETIWPDVFATMVTMNGEHRDDTELKRVKKQIDNWWKRWPRRAEYMTGTKGANNSAVLRLPEGER